MAESEMTGWRHIDTAPRDGSWVLVSDGKCVARAHWSADAYAWLSEQDFTELRVMAAGLDTDWPTHWMPLPAPPDTKD